MAGVRRHRYNNQFNISIIIYHTHYDDNKITRPIFTYSLGTRLSLESDESVKDCLKKAQLFKQDSTSSNTSLLTFHSVQPLFFPLHFDLLTKVTKALIIDNKQKVLFCKQKSVCLKLHFLLDNFFAVQFFSGIQNIDLGLSPNQTKLCRLHHLPFPIIFPF